MINVAQAKNNSSPLVPNLSNDNNNSMEGFRSFEGTMDDMISSPRDSSRANSVLKDLLSYYNLELEEEESDDNTSTFSFKQQNYRDGKYFFFGIVVMATLTDISSLRSSYDDYNRYVDEFESLVNKRNELQSGDGAFLTTFESKQDFNFGEDIDEVRKMLDEDDFIENYLTSVKELKESVTIAVSRFNWNPNETNSYWIIG